MRGGVRHTIRRGPVGEMCSQVSHMLIPVSPALFSDSIS